MYHVTVIKTGNNQIVHTNGFDKKKRTILCFENILNIFWQCQQCSEIIITLRNVIKYEIITIEI